MTRHLAKALDAIWYLSMGLFLGLTGGMVISVILTFRGAREIDAIPGAEPYSDPMFAEYHNDMVAGYIGQDLFMVGGIVALILFSIALLSRGALLLWDMKHRAPMKKWSMESIQGSCLGFAIAYLILASWTTVKMNRTWPNIYDQNLSDNEALMHRTNFDALHEQSESRVTLVWIFSFTALAVSPWSRRPKKSPLQSGDGEEEND